MPSPRAAIYTRVSTRHQAERAGTAAQRAALLQHAERRGWEVVHVFDEVGSGKDAGRPQLELLMRAVRRRQVDVVAVWRFDRFARSVSHLVNALEEMRALGVDFVSYQEGIDTSTPMGRAMFQITAAFAELEHAIIKERVQTGVDGARARGVKLGRPRKELEPEVARRALQEHGSIRKAAAALDVSPGLLRRRLKEVDQAA